MVFVTNNSRQRHFVGKSRELYKSCIVRISVCVSSDCYAVWTVTYPQSARGRAGVPDASREPSRRPHPHVPTSACPGKFANGRCGATGPERAHEVVVRRRLTAQPGGSPGCLLQLCNAIGSPAPLWALALQPKMLPLHRQIYFISHKK